MRIFLDNKGVSTLWSQFKAKLAVHADDSNIHVAAEEKASWNGKAELSDIPETLPANGGNADTVDGLHASDFAHYYTDTADCNNAIFMGTYNATPSTLNTPASGYWLIAVEIGASGNFIKQTATLMDSSHGTTKEIYHREYVNDGWSPWGKISDGGNADTLDGKHASDFAPYHSYAPIYTGDILDIPEMGTYSCAADGCTNLPSEIASWCYVTAFKFRDAGYKRFICVALNDVSVYPNVIWLASESNKTSDGKLIWSKANDGGNAATLDGKHASSFAQNIGVWNEGDIKDLLLSCTKSGFVFIHPGVTGMPNDNTYWFGLVDCNTPHRQLIVHNISNNVSYRITWNNGVQKWTVWRNLADGGNAATVNGYTVNANVPAGFSSIGQNTENKTYTYGRVTYTGHNTSEVFNNYTENMAANEYSHAEGYDTKALGDHSHAEGSGTKALGFHSHAECSSTEASGDGSHAEGMDTTASGECSHAEGSMTTASSSASHAEGSSTRASGNDSHAEGSSTKASGSHSHAEGSLTEASGESSHAEGLMTGASSSASHAEGYGTTASSFASHAGGKYNKGMTNSTGETDNTGDAFVIGNGTEAYTLSNAFRVTYGGAVYGLSAFNSSGADYAEFIKPWADGNPDNEDRVGYMVTIKNGLLHKANDGDYIVGITSGNPSVVGNADEDYYWRYARDEFNRFVYEDAEEEVEQLDDDGAPVLDENGMPVMVKTGNIIKNAHYKLAADYNPTKQNDYIERKNRPEWSYVGMVGVIPVRDDGTCEAGCFCKCGQNGIATRAESRGFDTFFVIERISDNVVSVEIR